MRPEINRHIYAIAIILAISGCRETSTIHRTFVCVESKLESGARFSFYDSIVSESNSRVIELSYYSKNEIIKIEKYYSTDELNYFFDGTIKDLKNDNIGKYDYLLFTPNDTNYLFKYSEPDDAIPVPVGSRDLEISINSKDTIHYSIRKQLHRNGVTLETFEFIEEFSYTYPIDLISISISNAGSVYLYLPLDHR